MFCKCAGCGTRDGSVAYSSQMQAFVCDECFTDYQDELEDANTTSCYPVNE